MGDFRVVFIADKEVQAQNPQDAFLAFKQWARGQINSHYFILTVEQVSDDQEESPT